jgi:hypothetical protein
MSTQTKLVFPIIDVEELRALLASATPRPWRVREHPADPDEFHVSAPTPEGNPYYGVTAESEIMSDEEYPTKRADAELIVAAVNCLAQLLNERENLEILFRRWKEEGWEVPLEDAKAIIDF